MVSDSSFRCCPESHPITILIDKSQVDAVNLDDSRFFTASLNNQAYISTNGIDQKKQ